MSRATPRKPKGRLVGLPQGRQGRLRPPPSPTRAMAPTALGGPEGCLRPLSEGVERPPELREAGLHFSQQALALWVGTTSVDGSGSGRRNLERFGGCRLPEARLGATQAQLALVRLPRQLNRLWPCGPDIPAGRTSRPAPGRSPRRGYRRGSPRASPAAFRTP